VGGAWPSFCAMPSLLALPDLAEGEDATSVVLCGCLTQTKEVQPVGHAFFERFERKHVSPSASPSPSDSGEEDQNGTGNGTTTKEKKKKKSKLTGDAALKLHDLLKGVDLYALMGCDDGCSQEDLKKAYRSLCLLHHPDKQGADKTPKEMAKINKHFLKIQEGHEVLSDVKKRRKYDSMGDFDDFVPSGLKKNQDFYTVFGPVFKRNAKWSERKPVPDLGDENTSYDTVDAFYEFWHGFETWRDMDEVIKEEEGDDCFMALEDADSREERRWMERENEKLRSKHRKAERQRVLKLVSSAEQCDPRVQAEKDRKWAVYEAQRAEKESKRLESEREAREEQERQLILKREAEEQRKQEKDSKDKLREAKKKARATLRKRVSEMDLSIQENQLQDFLLVLEENEMQSLMDTLTTDPQADTVFEAMRGKSFEPIIVRRIEEEESTADDESSQEELETVEETPEARAERERLAEVKRVEQVRRVKTAALAKVEEQKRREQEAAARAEEKLLREAKKKVDMEKREVERKKAEKKELEKQKKSAEKAEKDAQKALEKAEQEKEANRKRAEEQSEKQRVDNEAEELRKQLEDKQMSLERDRLKRVEALESMEWDSVVDLAKTNSVKTDVVRLLIASRKQEGEDRFDAELASLGSFFVLGVRPSKDSPVLSSNLRNRIKKLRTRLRASAAAGEFHCTLPNAKPDSVTLKKVLAAVVNGVVEIQAQAPAQVVDAQPVPVQAEPAAKKKTKSKSKPEEEDLDALLKEFDVVADKSSKPKKNKKK